MFSRDRRYEIGPEFFFFQVRANSSLLHVSSEIASNCNADFFSLSSAYLFLYAMYVFMYMKMQLCLRVAGKKKCKRNSFGNYVNFWIREIEWKNLS